MKEEEKKTCGTCRHYIGGGDWNLCCDLMYGLCYRDTGACERYEKEGERERNGTKTYQDL